MVAQVPELTICIPIGPMHEEVSLRAMESVKRQGDNVVGLAYHDTDSKGTGFARNALLERVATPFVAFLDADDWLEPEFAGLMLDVARKAGTSYVYSGWYTDEEIHEAPERCYCFAGDDLPWHLITAVIPTSWAKDIGGFDTLLPGMEDTDFFLRLQLSGHCGKVVNVPLVHYTPGTRSVAFRANSEYHAIKAKIRQKYDRGANMPCCQGDGIANSGPYGDKQSGDVQAEVIGTPRLYVGLISRRVYPRVGYNEVVWADPRDVQADPSRFRLVVSQVVEQVAPAANGNGKTITTAAEVAEVIEGFRYDGPYVYLPQNEGQKVQRERLSIQAIREMARYESI